MGGVWGTSTGTGRVTATGSRTRSSTSSTRSTQTMRRPLRTSCGISGRSFLFWAGRIRVLIPARCAARAFCFTPPMASTRPRRVTSPVMATSERTGRPERAETIAVVIVIPAEGPSLGTAPAGTCTCRAWRSKKSGVSPYSRECPLA